MGPAGWHLVAPPICCRLETLYSMQRIRFITYNIYTAFYRYVRLLKSRKDRIKAVARELGSYTSKGVAHLSVSSRVHY